MARRGKFGGSLPPGAASDPAAPWNQPDPEDYLPLICGHEGEDGEVCGFQADALADLDDHEHPEDCFQPPEPEGPPPCMVCNPPHDAHQRVRSGKASALVFCDHHDREDWKQKREAADGRDDPDAIADRYSEGDRQDG